MVHLVFFPKELPWKKNKLLLDLIITFQYVERVIFVSINRLQEWKIYHQQIKISKISKCQIYLLKQLETCLVSVETGRF